MDNIHDFLALTRLVILSWQKVKLNTFEFGQLSNCPEQLKPAAEISIPAV